MAGGVPALHLERRGQLNRSPRSNWVEKRGGLPAYINSVATALERQGMTRQHAIQVAINTVKKACATGLWGGQKRKISPAIQAAACKAAAQWEALKVSASIPSDQRLAVELARRSDAGLEPGAAVVELAAKGRAEIELASVGGRHVPGTAYEWRHGWIPLNARVAARFRKRFRKLSAAQQAALRRRVKADKQAIPVGDMGDAIRNLLAGRSVARPGTTMPTRRMPRGRRLK